jgi:hypothetical protein
VRPLRVLVLHAAAEANRTLSYQRGWPHALAADARFRCTTVNVMRPAAEVLSRLAAARLRRIEGVVLLHSIFSNEQLVGGRALQLVAELRAPKAYFIGNEYKLMPEKLAFAERVGIDLLVSQFTSPASLDLYRRRLRCDVVGIPNTGLDPETFAPRTPWDERSIDLGYRAYESPLYLGHDERRQIADRVREAAAGLRLDISLEPDQRFGVEEWAAFLNRCRGQLGTEAGGDYFELDDHTRVAVNAYLAGHPDASLADVRRRFFDDYGPAVPGRALSGRVVEAAGTKTVQLLLEGEYGGYFRPGEHYIEIRKDFSNLDDALEQFRDRALCERLRDAAYDLAMSSLTWDKLTGRFHGAFAPLVR